MNERLEKMNAVAVGIDALICELTARIRALERLNSIAPPGCCGPDLIVVLSMRQRQVMDLIVAGYMNKEIAWRLGISQRTVENHRATVMKKTGAKSLPDLIHLVMKSVPRREMLAVP